MDGLSTQGLHYTTKNVDRRRKCIELRLEGLTYADIGIQLNLSRQMIQKIVLPPSEIARIIYTRANHICEGCHNPLEGRGHIHHTASIIEDWDNPDFLQILCTLCHRLTHCGLTAISKAVSPEMAPLLGNVS